MDAPNLLFQYNNDFVAEKFPSLARRLIRNKNLSTFLKCVPSNTEDLKIVDMGCGNGQITKRIASLNPKSHVLGYDVSPQFVEMARKEEPHVENTEFHVMDMFNMEGLPDKSADLCIAIFSVHVKKVIDLVPLFQHIASKIQKGGRFKFITNWMEGNEGSAIPKAVMDSRAVPFVLGKESDEDTFRLVDFVYLPEELTDALTQAGFRCEKIDPYERNEKIDEDFEFREQIMIYEVIFDCILI